MTDQTTGQAADAADVLRLEQRIAAPPPLVFEYLVEPDKLLRWMGTEADIDPTPDGRFWLNVNGTDRAEGRYVAVDPPRFVSFTWGWVGSEHVPPGSSLVEVSLEADGDDTILTLTHSGLPGGANDQHREGWEHFLPLLTTAVT